MSEGNGFEVVERPDTKKPFRTGTWPIEAIIETARTGKAIIVPLNGVPKMVANHAMRVSLRYHGFHLRFRKHGNDAAVVWAEPR